MALINCKECGKEISTQAKVCPNCGAKTQRAIIQKKTNIRMFLFLLVLAVVIGAYILKICFTETEGQRQMRETEELNRKIEESYNEMLKNH